MVIMTTSRPAWTLTEAAERTGASRSTLRRYREAGKFPSAYKDPTGAWRFPLEDLLASGISLATPLGEQPFEQAQSKVTEQVQTNPVSRDAEQVAQLEQALREEKARADSAERLATIYRENLDDVRRALRMLEAGTSSPEQVPEQAQPVAQSMLSEHPGEQSSTDTLSTARPWWKRLTGL